MPKISHKDFSCILNMLESIKKIQDYSTKFNNADELFNDTKSFDAIIMNFIVIGEMVDKLSEELILETNPNIDWLKVKAFRNIAAHNYFGIDAEEVWQIIKGSMIELQNQLFLLIK